MRFSSIILSIFVALSIIQYCSAVCTCKQCTCTDECGFGGVGGGSPTNSPDGKCFYEPHNELVTWDVAVQKCAAEGKVLASHTSEAQRDWLQNYLRNNNVDGPLWLSGRGGEGKGWKWTTNGQTVPNPFFAPGEPVVGDHCTVHRTYYGRVGASPCDKPSKYICVTSGC